MFGLIPLETLPGWEPAADPTVLQILLVLLGIPTAIFAVIVLLTMAPGWFHRDGGDVAVRSDD